MVASAQQNAAGHVAERLGPAMRELPALCRKNHVVRLGIFGSAARDDFDPADSDFDFVVDFEPGYTLPWMGHVTRLQDDLKSLFRRPVDLLTRGASRNPFILEEISRTEVPLVHDGRLLVTAPPESPRMTNDDPIGPVIRKSLNDIDEACAELSDIGATKTLADYRSDRRLRWTVERAFTIIGEAMNRIRRRSPSLADRITAARSIVAFRNLIVHEYDLVDDDIVWDVIQKHVPKLRQEITSLTASLDQPE